jgi:hypothetical protein
MSTNTKLATPVCGDDIQDYAEARVLRDGDRSASAVALALHRKTNVIMVFVAMQTLVMVAMLVGGAWIYRDLQSKARKLEQVTYLIENPQVYLQQPGLATALSGLLQDTSSAFFLGAVNGTLSTFVLDTLQTDFASVAYPIANLATQLANAFQERQSQPQCTEYVQCTDNGTIQCPTGKTMYCESEEVVNCGNCPYGKHLELTSLIASVASRIANVGVVEPMSTNNTAALSDGLLRLNSVLTWVGNQGDVDGWAEAAQECDTFAENVQNVNWAGNYTGADGSSQAWDVNSNVAAVVQQVRTWCPIVASMSSQMRKPAKAGLIGANKLNPADVMKSVRQHGRPARRSP